MAELTIERYDQLVTLAYKAAFEPERWQDFCELMDVALDGAYVSLHGHDLTVNKNASAYYTRHPENFARSYQAHYDRLNPILPGLLRAEIGRPIETEEIIGFDDLFRTEYYNDWMRPQEDTGAGAGMVLFRSETRLLTLGAQLRMADAEEKTPLLLQLLGRIGPHVRRAFQVQRSLQGTQLHDSAGWLALDALADAVLFLDASGRPVHTNRSADRLFALGGPIGLDASGRLTFSDPAADAFLSKSLQAASTAGSGQIEDTFPVFLQPSEPAALMRIVPLAKAGSLAERPFADAPFVAPAAMLTIAMPRQPRSSTARRFGLTAAEAALAAALLEGSSLGAYAERRGLSIHTVRNQLRAVFQKTGVNRQSQLTALLARLP